MAKSKKPVIETVEFLYSGSEEDFDEFFKAVIKDYISEEGAEEMTYKEAV